MALHINVGGVWKEPAPSINVGGVWKTPGSVHINVGGVWKQVWQALAVNPPTTGVDILSSGSIVYAGMEFRNDGTLWRTSTGAGPTPSIQGDDWLTAGAASDVWIERVISSGSLNASDPGAGRLSLGTTRLYQVSDTSLSLAISQTCILTFNFYDAASGGNLLGTTGSITIKANREPSN